MVDFSSVNVSSNPGVATLINPQYIASVKHNKGYQSVSSVMVRTVTILWIVMNTVHLISTHQDLISS